MCSPNAGQNTTWTEASLKAFNELKEGIVKSILILPSKDDHLNLFVDTSEDCVGACLSTHKDQPITFASKKLTQTEARWSTIDKKANAVDWAIEKLRPFLLFHLSTFVFNEHQSLKYLLQSGKVSSEVHRWRVLVREFNFEI